MNLEFSTSRLATTEATVTTAQHWTASEAAQILIDYYGRDAFEFGPGELPRKLADAVAHRARVYDSSRQIAEMRAIIVANARATEPGPPPMFDLDADPDPDDDDDVLPPLVHPTDEPGWQPMEPVTSPSPD